jgi:BNR repeat-like domain
MAATQRWRSRILGRLGPGVLGPIAVLATATTALATVLTASTPVRVPDNPLANSSTTCSELVQQQEALGSVNHPDAEVEPYVIVDPTNALHLIASFQQDRWNDGGSNGLTNTVSTDGGAHWSLAKQQPQFSICEGAAAGAPGHFGRATDPWVAISADGAIAYSISDSFNADGPGFGGASSIIISRSTDGGETWQTPVTAEFDSSFTELNDKESITADPVNALNAYAVWDRLVSPQTNANPSATNVSFAFRGPALFSKTTDGGVTWSQGRVIFDPGQENQTIGNQVVVPTAGPAKGQLIDGFNLIFNFNRSVTPHVFNVAFIRSSDGGASWSGATIVNSLVDAPVTIGGQAVRTGDILPAWAASPTGNLYVVWQDGRFTGRAAIAFSQSTNGGATWSSPIRIDQTPASVQAFTPQLAVSSDGTIGVTYYNFQNATIAQPGLTDEYIVRCHAATSDCTNAANWAVGGEIRLSTTGSFDMKTAPNAGGFFTGDYEGLTHSGTIFDPFFVMAKPIATHGPTDPFASTAQ